MYDLTSHIISAFQSLLKFRVHPDLIRSITDTHSYRTGKTTRSSSAKQAVAILLNSSEGVGFPLGIGLWLSLSAQRLHFTKPSNQICCAKVVHSLTRATVTCDEGEADYVMRYMAKEFLQFVRLETSEITIIKYFFIVCLGANGFPSQPINELREYTRLRSQGILHDEALLRGFPVETSTWLFLRDIEVLLGFLARLEVTALDFGFQRTFEDFGKLFIGLAEMIYMSSSDKMEEWVGKLCSLSFRSSRVRQHLLLSIQDVVAHSALDDSILSLQSSLHQVTSEMEKLIL
ncbi:hypothetical protein BBP40_003104 [Aspergillus hancockii]|nr:hypothetical protein BBP40_003104 [Aspergillus hancockii]